VKTVQLLLLMNALWAGTAFAQTFDEVPARKITATLYTSSVVGPASPASKTNNATPAMSVARDIVSVDATVIAVEAYMSKPQRQRIEYSEDQIAVVGLAADASELTRIVMTDPRLVRVEALRGESDNSVKRLYRQSVDFSFLVFDEAVVSVRILKPRWGGDKWLFDVLAEARIE